jgi:hypothetical protein
MHTFHEASSAMPQHTIPRPPDALTGDPEDGDDPFAPPRRHAA